MQEKKSSFIIKFWRNINVADVGVTFHNKSKFENNEIYKSKDGVDWIFNVIENKHKNLHCNFHHDDDGDGDNDNDHDLNFCDTFKVNKSLYDDNNDNLLKDLGYHNEDYTTNCKYYSLINRIKN